MSLRTVFINLVVLLGLLLALLILPLLVFDAYQAWRRQHVPDPRGALALYHDIPWAKQHFREFARLTTKYQDYIGWRREPFAGETLNIDAEGFRMHPGRLAREQSTLWFFGGSTTWGPGADDASTLPALVQAHGGLSTFNFGESAYTAHQSLNLLAKSYVQGGTPRLVVFYDGANEVAIKCRVELGFFSTFQEALLRERTQSQALSAQLLSPARELLGRILHGAAAQRQGDMGYDCHRNVEKRERIARALVLDWQMARQLAESRGGRFLAVLQPVAFTGKPQLAHLPDVLANKALREQYDAVYPLIRQHLHAAGVPYLDLADALDGREAFYIDFAHLAPKGNDRMARRIVASDAFSSGR